MTARWRLPWWRFWRRMRDGLVVRVRRISWRVAVSDREPRRAW